MPLALAISKTVRVFETFGIFGGDLLYQFHAETRRRREEKNFKNLSLNRSLDFYLLYSLCASASLREIKI